jgi:hypothetical protein
MPLFLRSERFNVTQAYSKQSRQGRPEPLKLEKTNFIFLLLVPSRLSGEIILILANFCAFS